MLWQFSWDDKKICKLSVKIPISFAAYSFLIFCILSPQCHLIKLFYKVFLEKKNEFVLTKEYNTVFLHNLEGGISKPLIQSYFVKKLLIVFLVTIRWDLDCAQKICWSCSSKAAKLMKDSTTVKLCFLCLLLTVRIQTCNSWNQI